MKKKPKQPALLPAAKAGATLAVGLAVVWLTGLAGISQRPTRIWRGYDTLLIRPDLARAGVIEKVAREMGPGVVSEHTATASYWNFTGIETTPVDMMNARIDPSDPRHDRVMDGLPGYFQRDDRGGGWSILYIPSRRAAVVDYLRIATILGLPWHRTWCLEEFDPVELLVSAFGLLAMTVLLAHPAGKGGKERLLLGGVGALLWVPFVLPGGIARLSLSLLLLAAWFPAVRILVELHGWDEKLLREARSPLLLFLAATGAGFVLLLAVGGFSAALLFSYAGCIIGSVALVISLALFWGKARRPRKRRKGFDPVPIVRPSTVPSRLGPTGLVLSFGAVLVVAALVILRSVPLPTPDPVPGVGDFSWESLARLSKARQAQGLPDISDLVAHEAFQETLAFGRPWGLPRRDERVYVREFSTNARTGTIVASMRQVKVFDSTWLDAILLHPPPGSVEALLLSQGRASAVALRGQTGNLLRELPVALLALLALSAWFAWEQGSAPLMRNVLPRLNGATRRSQAQ